MIDLQIESALTAAAVAKLPQLRRNGKPPHVSQVHRWWTAGLKGHRLESIVVAGTRCSTSEAVDRWIAALSGHDSAEGQRTPIRRQKETARADKQLAAAGW
jgi:hypothetical protein